MPSGLIPDHSGAPRHFSLPSIQAHYRQCNKPQLTVGHCDKMNLFYIREAKPSPQLALMKYRKVKDNTVQINGMYVPKTMRGRGVSSALAREALNHMAEKNMWIDVRCPITKSYINNNQYANYVRQLVVPLRQQQRRSAAY